MAGGGLFDPLGTDRPARAPRAGISLWLIALLVVLLGVAGLFGTAAIRNSGEGGEPRVVAEIGPAHHVDPAPPSPPLGSAVATTQIPPVPSGAVATSDQDVEVENGVRVIRPRRNGSPGGSLVMKVPDAAPVAFKAADDGLLEPGPSGLLPRVGADGRRAAEVYAGAAVPGTTGKPLISLVVGGLGNGSAGPEQAAMDWPAGVTLGFSVDETDLARRVANARAAGHEVVLMLPPLAGATSGAATTSSGGANASSTRDRLHWQLSRFTGYAGVVMDPSNLDVADAGTDILEMVRRGLYVVDSPQAHHGAAPASSAHVAGSLMATVDVRLTETTGNDSPEGFLQRLASLARSDGSAIGIAPASPRTLAAVSKFAATLADTGVALVPLGIVVNLRQTAQARPIPVAAP